MKVVEVFNRVVNEGRLPTDLEALEKLVGELHTHYATKSAIIEDRVDTLTHWFACRTVPGPICLYFGTPESFERWRLEGSERQEAQ